MNTRYHRERILMSRLLLEMCRRASRYVEGKSLGAKMEAVLILIAIALGYMEGRPFNASKLAAYLDTPRTSVLRKLAQLKREGFVAQRGHTYVLHDHLLNSVGIEDTRAAIRMIRSLAEQLIQFDNEGVQNGHENPFKITSLPISKLPERHGRYWVHPVDDGTVHGPSFNRETENAVDSNSMAGQSSYQIVRSSSLRQVMRFAARFNAVQPPEALISVYRHMNGVDPRLVAKRLVADRFWKYLEKYQ